MSNKPEICLRVFKGVPSYSGSELTSTSAGCHAFFVAHVPFIPSFRSKDFAGTLGSVSERVKLVTDRQRRFLNDMVSKFDMTLLESPQSVELRLVSSPQPGQPYSRIRMYFIGKAFHMDENVARKSITNLWLRFTSYFPSEEPFNFPLVTITSADLSESSENHHTFKSLFQEATNPFGSQSKLHFVEIRKFKDHDPSIEPSTSSGRISFFPHSFRPNTDITSMSRFLETFAKQDETCVVSIRLRPTKLFEEEYRLIDSAFQWYQNQFLEENETQNWRTRQRKIWFEQFRSVYEPMVQQRDHLYLMNIQVVSEKMPKIEVASALASELLDNTKDHPHLWIEAVPTTDEDNNIAFSNFIYCEFQPWDLPHPTTPRFVRVSNLCTSHEALGAFRLPIPPESGHMPGIIVRDEPFVLHSDFGSISSSETTISLGKVLHRGTITNNEFYVTLSQLRRHSMIAGSTGSGKTNTCLHILSQLWKTRGSKIPFLILYPIDKPDYRFLCADAAIRDDLLVFTIGDDTVSPFRFNPLAVPDGVLVRTHISHLMRAFKSAFSLWDPLPAVYREALRETYKRAGFNDLRVARGGQAEITPPVFSEFYTVLLETSQAMTKDYGQEAKGNIRQGAEIRIRDLIQNLGHVINVRGNADWNLILSHPTVMELGRVGSSEDTALIMGLLLMSLLSHLSTRDPLLAPQHFTLVEEAHRLMPANKVANNTFSGDARGQASEDFANLLAEVRGFKEGILIAEQTPTELVSGAIANTYLKIGHWLEENNSFELFAQIMNLNDQQREYARTLPTGYAILRTDSGRPALIKVTPYIDGLEGRYDYITDDAVRTFMGEQSVKHQLNVPQYVEVSDLFREGTEQSVSTRPGCNHCELIHGDKTCSSKQQAERVMKNKGIQDEIRPQLISIFQGKHNDNSSELVNCAKRIFRALRFENQTERLLVVCCYLANEATLYAREIPDDQNASLGLLIGNSLKQFKLETEHI